MKRLRVSFEVEWGKDDDEDDRAVDRSPAVGFVWDPPTNDSDEGAERAKSRRTRR